MGGFGNNNANVRGNACGFPAAGHTKTVDVAEEWILAAGDVKISPTGSGDTSAPDIC